jgi:hypothetical protein
MDAEEVGFGLLDGNLRFEASHTVEVVTGRTGEIGR